MAKLSAKDALEILHTHDLRATPHRVLIVQEISKYKEPVTVYSLVDSVRSVESIDQATVYRTLTALEEAHIVRRLDFNHGHAHYELETGELSYRLVCSACETTEKVNVGTLDESVKKILKKSTKFGKTARSVEIYALCKKCS